jgi:hypothetical protein
MESVRDTAGSKPLLWFGLAYAVFFLNDVLFIRTTDWPSYLAIDYGSRFLVLALLLLPQAPRQIAVRPEPLHVPPGQVFVLIAALIAWDQLLGHGLLQMLAAMIRGTRLMHFPVLPPGIKQVDVLVGVALVAISEELLCRKFAKVVLRAYLRSDAQLIVVSALLFAGMHWSHGVPNVIYIFLEGLLDMAVYLRVGALWPLIVAHYVIDVIWFW